MSAPVSSIRNLGPVMEAAFAEVGIDSADALREIGADQAYARLLANGHKPHFIAYYVLVMGLQGRPWNDCKGAEKAALRARFDALKAAAKPVSRDPDLPADLARFLADHGLRPAPGEAHEKGR